VLEPALPAASASYGVSPITTTADLCPELVRGGLKDIRMGFGLLGVIRGDLNIDQSFNAGDLLVGAQFRGFRG
jgi:hypothetical protein